jgi:hypothetical protein
MHVPELVWLPIILLPPANYIMINRIMANANNCFGPFYFWWCDAEKMSQMF